jgi:hypothetical protein
MTRSLVVTLALLASGLAACSKEPEQPVSPAPIPPGAAATDVPREVPYTPPDQRPSYTSDRPGTPPRSGINSDPNNPSGAPGSNFGPTTYTR